MSLQTDIRFIPEQNLYELSLPQEAATMLGLPSSGGSSVSIHHESKMKLEWLAISIREKWELFRTASGATKQRWTAKRKKALVILSIAILAGLGAPLINRLTHFDKTYIWMIAFTLGVVCCLQILKYLAQEMAAKENTPDLTRDLMDLRDQIDKDFSL